MFKIILYLMIKKYKKTRETASRVMDYLFISILP